MRWVMTTYDDHQGKGVLTLPRTENTEYTESFIL